MKAKLVLNDCRVALAWAEDAETEQEFRVRWVAVVALLRAVGHVLDKVDTMSSPHLSAAIKEKWKEWQANREDNQIFWKFIEAERNNILKQYEAGYEAGDITVVVEGAGAPESFLLGDALYKPLKSDGPYEGEDARDVAQEAISWWERQLSAIESGKI